ncbi:MBL fold metallo-hydrolase [Christensenellaceae bacterium OttesenSCG-928-K19]|nr:MBL fold metallo-hydrolase [Christensenellaceae bacterium OttesenSCG-928-K19]
MDFTELTKKIYYLTYEEKRDRPVLGYVNGERFSLAVDAGGSPAHANLFYDALYREGLALPEYTAITHWHWDHTFGMCAVSGKTVAHVNTGLRLQKMSGWAWSDSAIQERIKTGEDIFHDDVCMQAEYPHPEEICVVLPDILFSDKVLIDLGGVHCHIMKIPSPHSDDTTAILVQEEKVLFLGDATCPDYYNGDVYDRAELNFMIRWLEGCNFDICVLGHCEPISKVELVDYLKTI